MMRESTLPQARVPSHVLGGGAREGRPQASGFTIVELLLVVALIALLISFIIPSLASARRSHETLICAHHLREILNASAVYSGDNKGEFVSSWDWVNSSIYGLNGWYNYGAVKDGTLYPYIPKAQDELRICPTFRSVYRSFPGNADREVAFSYSMNSYLGNGTWNSKKNIRQTISIRHPSELLVFCDENAWLTPYSTYSINNGSMGVGPWTGGHTDCIGSMHYNNDSGMTDGYGNVAFADGHVKLHHVSESKKLATPAQFIP
jgi:prepilin-type processing-associated H-X9-DG protein